MWGRSSLTTVPALASSPFPLGALRRVASDREGVRYAVEEITTLKTLVL